MKKQSKQQLQEQVLGNIKLLFKQAKDSSQEKANDLVKKARRIGMKINLPIPRDFKRKYCKHCNNYFKSGNYRVRTRNKMVIYYCLKCKKYSKFKIS
jgi:ribonuclease P protein subunit RPR2